MKTRECKMRFREFVNTTSLTADQAQQKAIAGVVSPAGGNGALQLKGAQQLDAAISRVGFERAYMAMRQAVSQILSDERAVVEVFDDTQNKFTGQMVPWGQLFKQGRNDPSRGYIEIEYKPQQGRSIIGDIGYTIGRLKNWRNLVRLPFEKIGIVSNPEEVYRNSFQAELDRLQNQPSIGSEPQLTGTEEWEVTTSRFGRNIIIKPKRR
jgi:hypothetical protein